MKNIEIVKSLENFELIWNILIEIKRLGCRVKKLCIVIVRDLNIDL